MTAAAHDVDRRADGGQRRAQLVAHVGGEAGLPVDAVLEGVDHLVEGGDQRGEVGIALGVEAGVEGAVGDPGGGRRHAPQRPQHPAAGVAADAGAAESGEGGSEGQGPGQQPESPIELPERDELEVGGLGRRQGDTHRHLGRAVEQEPLASHRPGKDGPT